MDQDDALRARIVAALHVEGFSTSEAATGEDALESIERCPPTTVVLDWVLPGMTGLEVCRRLRAGPHADLPVLMLSSRSEELDRVVGLEAGADDFVAKSALSMRELVLRIRAVRRRGTRRTRPRQQVILRHGDFALDLGAHRAFADEQELELTQREFRLLEELVRAQGRVCTREQLLQRIWGSGDAKLRTVDSHVRRLRGKLGGAASTLCTVRGVGYRLETHVANEA